MNSDDSNIFGEFKVFPELKLGTLIMLSKYSIRYCPVSQVAYLSS